LNQFATRAARVLAACAAMLLCASAALAREFPRPETFTLANGLQVVIVTDRRAPVVTHQLWYRVGAADEPRGHSGMAHFFEHLMFKGTDHIPRGEFSRIIARNGGDDNARTSWDFTEYYERIARDRLELVMSMEADRMRHLNLPGSLIASERDVIIEERRQRIDNVPGAVLAERMRAMLHPNSPYGTPVIGWLHEMRQLNHDDALQFYRTWYAPNNAILVVAGDIDAAELRPIAERTYGRLQPTRNLAARHWATDPPPVGPMHVVYRDEKVRQPSLSRFYSAITYASAPGRQAHALDVAVQILGGSETSRLYRTLVEQRHLAVNAYAGADLSGLGGGTISVGATPAEGVSLETLEAAIDHGPTDAELQRARSQMAAAAIYAQDSQEALATMYGSSLAQGETMDAIVQWPDQIERVTREEAMAAAREGFNANASVTGYLLPPEQTP
jgi:zinc protease